MTEVDNSSALLKDIPDSYAGRHLKWYLVMLLSSGEGASVADHERYTPEFAPRMGPFESDEQEREGQRLGASDQGGEISEPPGGGQIHGRRYAWKTVPDIPRQ